MLKLLKPKSFLRYAKNMTVAELKNVTDKDVMEYQTEWTSNISPAFEADKGELQGINSKMEQLSIQVYENRVNNTNTYIVTLRKEKVLWTLITTNTHTPTK